MNDTTWGGRFSYILPKEEIRRRILAMHADMSTPWTFRRMHQEMGEKLSYDTLVDSVTGKTTLTDRTQTILSRFLQLLDSGRLIVRYADPTARRYQWGTKHAEIEPKPSKDLPFDHPESVAYRKRIKEARMARNHANRVEVIRSAIPQQKTIKQMTVSIGAKGPSLKPSQKTIASPEMPAFADVVKVK